MVGHALLAISSFIVTNIDDLLILIFYFASGTFKTSRIVLGQIVGISFLVVVSLMGLFFEKLLADHWISLLGLLPLYLGLRELKTNQQEGTKNVDQLPSKAHFPILQVASVTIANGGDNIGVYVPMFAKVPSDSVHVYVITYLLLTLAWCAIAYYLVEHRYLGNMIHRYGKSLFPFFLILLGFLILYDFFVHFFS